MPFMRAKTTLEMWTRQKQGRLKKLDGPLPLLPGELEFLHDRAKPDAGQTIPPEAVRPKKKRKTSKKP